MGKCWKIERKGIVLKFKETRRWVVEYFGCRVADADAEAKGEDWLMIANRDDKEEEVKDENGKRAS